MQRTSIEYLTHTWNPLAMRCTPVSPGCRNCWHLAMCKRHAANPKLPANVRRAKAGGPPVLLEDELDAPLRLRKPATIGVQYMGDLFHHHVRVEHFARVWRTMVMMTGRGHTFLVLSKRPHRAKELLGPNGIGFYATAGPVPCPQPGIWLGVSVENQQTADERIPWLLQCPAAVRFVSYEPALGGVDFHFGEGLAPGDDSAVGRRPCDQGGRRHQHLLSELCWRGIDWVIAGCESGPRRRPAELDWFRSVRDQCVAAGVPLFLKQMEVDGKVTHMPPLDGRVWAETPSE